MGPKNPPTLRIELWNKNILSRDDLLGSCELSLDDIPKDMRH